ncbi:GNAT family N-acetyltransferase [Notoacmeibacter sp. MSK16QG-6]|uniref:GNAT family N-acetyltransferase n=1 Tax=Notoacmeibacter sp. MSK16QG-6 TaxID=2957982 RepID=UPI00209C7456|nr:GNAT family N-acetyltransferase [Notoacmeibacter sp. MSK16QG-6]MCP1198309.1 acetyltransferase [Notoacmeibacter sp. MSK16QG-6]
MTALPSFPAIAAPPILDLWEQIDALFAATGEDRIELPSDWLTRGDIALHDLRCGSLRDDAVVVDRGEFYQSAGMWTNRLPLVPVATGLVPGPDGRDHPRRPAKPAGRFYERFDRDGGCAVSFDVLEIGSHLALFHKWQNDPRVAYFWEEDKSEEELAAYLSERIDNPSVLPTIVCFDGDPAGYLEFYWAREDRLGAYYDSHPWDRGWHGLIGERRHLGRRKTAAWLRSLTHYLFLDCPLTEKVVGEPRADNIKLLRYTDPLAYRKIREFDFPHKRAALMHCYRNEFFEKVRF